MAGVGRMVNMDFAAHKVGGQTSNMEAGRDARLLKAGVQGGNKVALNYGQVGGNRNLGLRFLNAGLEKLVGPVHAGQSDSAVMFKRKPEAMAELYQRFEGARKGGGALAGGQASPANFTDLASKHGVGQEAIKSLEQARTKAYAAANEFQLTGDSQKDRASGSDTLALINNASSDAFKALHNDLGDGAAAMQAYETLGNFTRGASETVLGKLAEVGIYQVNARYPQLRQLPEQAQALAKQKQALLDQGGRAWDSLDPEALVDLHLYAEYAGDYLSAATGVLDSEKWIEAARLNAYVDFFDNGKQLALARLDQLKARRDAAREKLTEVYPGFVQDKQRITKLNHLEKKLIQVEGEVKRLLDGSSLDSVNRGPVKSAIEAIEGNPSYQHGRKLHAEADSLDELLEAARRELGYRVDLAPEKRIR